MYFYSLQKHKEMLLNYDILTCMLFGVSVLKLIKYIYIFIALYFWYKPIFRSSKYNLVLLDYLVYMYIGLTDRIVLCVAIN